MHEGREEEVRKRRDMRSIMDTSDDEEDDRDMVDVVSTVDLGGFKEAEEREKVNMMALSCHIVYLFCFCLLPGIINITIFNYRFF